MWTISSSCSASTISPRSPPFTSSAGRGPSLPLRSIIGYSELEPACLGLASTGTALEADGKSLTRSRALNLHELKNQDELGNWEAAMIIDSHGHVTAPDSLYVYKAGLLAH